MLLRLSLGLVKNLCKKGISSKASLLNRGINRFSSDKSQSITSLLNIVNQTIETELTAVPENKNEQKQYFAQNNWQLQQKGSNAVLSKKVQNYEIKIFFKIRNLVNNSANQGQQQQQLSATQFNEVMVYVSKDNVNWMGLQFILSRQEVSLSTLNFIDNIKQQIALKSQFDLSSAIYGGPDIQTLSEEFVEEILNFVQRLGVSTILFQNIEQYYVKGQQKNYVKWLKDIQSVLQ